MKTEKEINDFKEKLYNNDNLRYFLRKKRSINEIMFFIESQLIDISLNIPEDEIRKTSHNLFLTQNIIINTHKYYIDEVKSINDMSEKAKRINSFFKGLGIGFFDNIVAISLVSIIFLTASITSISVYYDVINERLLAYQLTQNEKANPNIKSYFEKRKINFFNTLSKDEKLLLINNGEMATDTAIKHIGNLLK